MKVRRKHIGSRVTSDVLRMSDWKCFYCKNVFTQDDPPTIDHILPIYRGGTNTISNLVAAHAKCNHDKGSKYIGEVFPDKKDFEDAVKIYFHLTTLELRVLRWTRRTEHFFTKIQGKLRRSKSQTSSRQKIDSIL